MKKFFITLSIAIILAMSALLFGCNNSADKIDGYYMLSLNKSSVVVNGTERTLPDYLDWQNMTLEEYETFGVLTIYVEGENLVIYSDGAYLVNGTYELDGETMVCSGDITDLLRAASVQNLKWKNGEISFTMNLGNYTHNRVYAKIA